MCWATVSLHKISIVASVFRDEMKRRRRRGRERERERDKEREKERERGGMRH